MKSLLTTLSAIILATTGMIPTVANINKTNPEPQRRDIVVKLPEGNFLEASSGYNGGNFQGVWDFVTVNLGTTVNPDKIIGIDIIYNDSYSEHKVDALNYYNRNYDGGSHHRGQFNGLVFRPGRANRGWNLWDVILNSQPNFSSHTRRGGFEHDVYTGIKYWWHFNNNGELLVDIVSYIRFDIFSRVGISKAAVNLGSYISFFYY